MSSSDAEGKLDRVMGRTPSGQLFEVIETQDLLQNLFAHRPTLKTHTAGELFTLALVAVQIVAFLGFGLIRGYKWYFLGVFVFWRLAYNAGLGLILQSQSQSQWFAQLCRSTGCFDREQAEK